MSFFKNLLSDLIAKRLWPVAIALVAALVAVPVVLGSSAPADGAVEAPLPLGASAAEAATNAQVALVSAPGVKNRAGDKHNPFKQDRVAAAADPVADSGVGALAGATTGGTSVADTSASGVVPVATGTGTGTGTDTDTGTTTTTPTQTKKPKAKTTRSYDVDVSFGPIDTPVKRDNLPRLTPLPSADQPLLVFLGVLGDGKTAAFLVSSDATNISGDGTCRPNPKECRTIEVPAGDTVFFDVEPEDATTDATDGDTAADGTTPTATTSEETATPVPGTVTYQLDVRKVKGKVSTDATGRTGASKANESAIGRKALRTAIDAGASAIVGRYGYSSESGVLERTDHYGVVVRTGQKGATATRSGIKRLTPLPSQATPDFVYVGVRSDRKAAIFQNVIGGAKGGQGACSPSPLDCRLLELGIGETAFFDRTAAGRGIQELGLEKITVAGTGSIVAARQARTEESAIGRALLRRTIAAGATELVQRFRYDARTGLVRSATAK